MIKIESSGGPMEAIKKEELEQQAKSFAAKRIAFLDRRNAESKNGPRAAAAEQRSIIELLFMRFVASHRIVTPDSGISRPSGAAAGQASRASD